MDDDLLTDTHHAWFANTFGIDPRNSSDPAAAQPVSTGPAGPTGDPGQPAAPPSPPGPDVIAAPQGKPADSSYGDALQKVAEAALQEFLKTPEGKALQEKLERAEKDIPDAVKYAVAGSVIAAVFAGSAATHQELPVTKSPAIPLFKIGDVAVKGQVTWKGPADKPTEAKVMFTFDIPLGKDPPKPKKDTAGGAAGLEPSGNYAPPPKEGSPVLLANFDGAYGVDKIMKTLAAHTTSHGGGRIIVVGYYVAQDAPTDDKPQVGERTDDAAQARADTLKNAIAQEVDASRYKTESLITFKETGGRSFGLGAEASELGTRDTAVIFIPQG